MVEINLRNITCCRMNETCLHMNDVLWEYRRDLTTKHITMAIFSIFYTLIIIFGIIGNLCVILAISRTRSLQTVPNMFIFSLSCSDIVVCCTSATITPITGFVKEWLFGSFLCSVAPFIAGVSLCFSTFTLAAISIDRFMLIRFPMKKPFSHAQASVAILLICILAATLSMPTMFTQTLSNIDNYCGTFCYEDWGTHQSRRRAYGTVMLTLQFIIPLSIIIICYTAISVRLGQSLILKTTKKRDYDWQLQVTDQQRAANKRRQRTNRMFIGMVVAFSLSWFWSVLFNVLRDYEILPTFAKQQEFFVGILTHCIAMTSTVWNPLLYAMLNFQLRAAFLQLMPECIRDTFCSKVSSSSSIPHDDITRRKPPAITIANGNAKNANNNKKSSTSLRPTTPSTLLIANNNAQGISTIDDDDDNFNYNSDGTNQFDHHRQSVKKVFASAICCRTGERQPDLEDMSRVPSRLGSSSITGISKQPQQVEKNVVLYLTPTTPAQQIPVQQVYLDEKNHSIYKNGTKICLKQLPPLQPLPPSLQQQPQQCQENGVKKQQKFLESMRQCSLQEEEEQVEMMMEEKLVGGSEENPNVMQQCFGIQMLKKEQHSPLQYMSQSDNVPLQPDLTKKMPSMAMTKDVEEQESLLDTVEL